MKRRVASRIKGLHLIWIGAILQKQLHHFDSAVVNCYSKESLTVFNVYVNELWIIMHKIVEYLNFIVFYSFF